MDLLALGRDFLVDLLALGRDFLGLVLRVLLLLGDEWHDVLVSELANTTFPPLNVLVELNKS